MENKQARCSPRRVYDLNVCSLIPAVEVYMKPRLGLKKLGNSCSE